MTARRTNAPAAAPGEAVGRQHPGAPNPLWRLGFGVVLLAQLVVLYAPHGPAGPELNGLDKVVHASIFLAPAFAGLVVGLRARWVLGILAVHAPLSELVQHLALPHRDGDVFDVMADLGGIVLGGLAFLVWARRQP